VNFSTKLFLRLSINELPRKSVFALLYFRQNCSTREEEPANLMLVFPQCSWHTRFRKFIFEMFHRRSPPAISLSSHFAGSSSTL
jgi:hypothetical protein